MDLSNNPVVWSSSSLPAFRRFEIVSSGVDTLVGINRTKFGDKALLLNNRYGHVPDICDGHFDINKIVKRFKVTEENRNFTVWYAAVLELPSNIHVNSQPYFSIECDRAPSYNLCFEPSILKCRQRYSDSICKGAKRFDTVAVTGWNCHRITLPKNMIDSIATLEITAADCGCAAHFGYAYVDGICEECTGSALGSAKLYDQPFDSLGLGIKYRSCNGDTITICGSYTLPSICGTWKLDSLKAPGYAIYNLETDTTNHKFCFDLAKSNFPDTCKDLYVTLYFSSNTTILPPIFSNSIEICTDDFEEYDANVTTGVCQNNNTSSLISDDYYYVSVDLSVNYGDFWTMERELDDPYPGEAGDYIIKTGTGSGTIDLGPLLIQEGSWDLTITIGGCTLFYEITPPYFCSGCNNFRQARIRNVTCVNSPANSNPLDDTWSFDVTVPGSSGTYYVYKSTGTLVSTCSYGSSPCNVYVGTIGTACKKYYFQDGGIGGSNCKSYFNVCPPKPCSTTCDVEAYVTDVYCTDENSRFYANLAVSGGGSSYYCYESFAMSDPGNTSVTSYHQGSFSNPLGPFYEDVYVIIYLCNSSACSCSETCFKSIYIPFPDCDNLSYRNNEAHNSGINTIDELMVIPNPVNDHEIVLRSTMNNTSFEFYNSSAKLIHHDSFRGTDYRFRPEIPSGLYFVRYKNNDGKYKYIKVIKF